MTPNKVALAVCGLLIACSTLLGGCVHQGILDRAEQIKTWADEARSKQDDVQESGGPLCGARELAVADAQYAFAMAEIKQGDHPLVREHTAKGLAAAEMALLKARACEPPDRDHDGLLDDADGCPDDAEDKDGYEDADGCPEPDNDHDGLLDGEDKCPNEPEDRDGFQDGDGCPEPDNDQDGILDNKDICPDDAEDKDSFDDGDGCPDPDNDRDGILDAQDKCPREPQTYNGEAPLDGCPVKANYSLVEITADAIEIKQMVYFATNKDVILAKSFPLLNEVAKALQDNPTFVIEVGGHTDNRGNAAHNQKLSQRRAESVRRYLVEKGKIPAARLKAQGYGDTQPIATNQTQTGRDKNRRVEFKIVGR